MGDTLSKSLAKFISNNNDFSDPFEDNNELPKSSSTKEFIKNYGKKGKKQEKPKKKDDDLNSLYQTMVDMTDGYDNPDLVQDFDSYLGDYLVDDEEDEIRRSLIKHGRKYARDTKISKEASEIQKAYASSEEDLTNLLEDVNNDKACLQNDLAQMRANRSRNYNVMAKIMEQKATLHNVTLGAIKEKNNMTKAQIELQMKYDKENNIADGDSDIVANKAIQNLFSMGRDNLIGSYSDISGSSEAGYIDDDGFDEDDIINEKYFSDDDDKPKSDGDKFIEYEGMGVHYVLEYDDRGPIQIISEDMDGNVIPDYPTPDINDLEFSISEATQTATDNLSQQYKLRKV